MRGNKAMFTLLAGAALAAGTVPAGAWATSAVAAPAQAGREAGSPFAPGTGQLVVDWNKALITILSTPGAQPATIHPTRSFAILQAAEYDAVASAARAGHLSSLGIQGSGKANPDGIQGSGKASPDGIQGSGTTNPDGIQGSGKAPDGTRGSGRASAAAAADQAARDVLVALYPAQASVADGQLATELAGLPDGIAKDRGIALGDNVAMRLLALRAGDGSAAAPAPFTPGTAPGDYQLTPPNFPAPVFTNWGTITPFVLRRGSQFRPAPPPPVTSAAYARALAVVQSLGQDTSTTRTADQTAAGRFWGAAPIWNVWNEIAQDQVTGHHASLVQAAAAFAALDLTLGDTAIGLYDAKYHYQVWRPVTAIREGASTGNPAITANPAWSPLTVTAADPSYPGAHSGFSFAAATVLSAFFGADQPVTVHSDALPGQARAFGGFFAAATEAALSRIYAGQHTPLDDQAGRILGVRIATFVLASLSFNRSLSVNRFVPVSRSAAGLGGGDRR
jgi:membrane-associated phospholipid phosphatase